MKPFGRGTAGGGFFNLTTRHLDAKLRMRGAILLLLCKSAWFGIFGATFYVILLTFPIVKQLP